MKTDIVSLKYDVRKSAVTLENMQKDIKTLAEVQKNHMEENEKQHTEIITVMNAKMDVVELAVKDLGKEVSKHNNEIEVLAKEDFNIKVDINGVKNELKIVKGGKDIN